MRLPRPYIPLSVRVQVAERQLLALTSCRCTNSFRVPLSQTGASMRSRLDAALFHLSYCGIDQMHLDHDPPLAAREKIRRKGVVVGYRPAANDPAFLVYRAAVDHRIKTNVRGDGAQHPDRVLIKKARRQERGRKPRLKRRWPSRPFPKGRKLRTRS